METIETLSQQSVTDLLETSENKFSDLHLGDSANVITESIPGPVSIELLKKLDLYESNNCYYPRSIPIAFEKAKGSIIEDVDGNQYIDFFSGSGVLNFGHNNAEIIPAIEAQLKKLIHTLDFPTIPKIEFMEALNSILPEGMKGNVKFNFCGPTGADSVEAALKIVKMNTKRHTMIAFQGSYHGMTQGALSVTSHVYHKQNLPSLIPGTHFVPFANCYRCPFGKQHDSCALECAKNIRNILDNPGSGVEKPAGIIMEPVQSEAGTIVPKAEFVEEVLNIGKDYEIPIIFDEIQAGFYRTGKLFSHSNFTAKSPDVVTLSKGLGGVGMPIALTIFKKHLDTWSEGTHLGTFRGNQLSIAAGGAAIKFIKKHNLEDYIKETHAQMMDRLLQLKQNSKFIGDVRGLGMMFGIEYVKDKKEKTPFPEIVGKIVKKCYQSGIIITSGGNYGNVVRFLPPLVSTKTIINNGLDIFEEVHHSMEKEFSK